jgi:hypothetical protein
MGIGTCPIVTFERMNANTIESRRLRALTVQEGLVDSRMDLFTGPFAIRRRVAAWILVK